MLGSLKKGKGKTEGRKKEWKGKSERKNEKIKKGRKKRNKQAHTMGQILPSSKSLKD